MRIVPLLIGALLILRGGLTHASIVWGQVDDFENGTTQGWSVGDPSHPAPPSNVATGGPAGLNDNYLKLQALGVGDAGSRLAVFNRDPRWSGNFTASGLPSITMDVNNFGPSDAYLRLLFSDQVAGMPTNVAITDAVLIPGSSGWTKATWSIALADLTADKGDKALAFANVTEIRLFHNPNATFGGPGNGIPPISVTLGIDNIAAPEPSSAVVIVFAAHALLMRRRGH
jgi:hypothetical protein